MILVDTNIVGTFTLVGALDQLFALFIKDEIGIAPAVYAELAAGVTEGCLFLQAALGHVESGELKLFALTAEEIIQRHKLPPSLHDGEAESIVLCQVRGGAFVTNDRRARNYCRSVGVEVFDLVELLRALWKLGVCSKRKVKQLVADIETKEGMVIKGQEQIFGR